MAGIFKSTVLSGSAFPEKDYTHNPTVLGTVEDIEKWVRVANERLGRLDNLVNGSSGPACKEERIPQGLADRLLELSADMASLCGALETINVKLGCPLELKNQGQEEPDLRTLLELKNALGQDAKLAS